ncbi:MAG TPA: MXAN_5187 C-terminal domain-containing protein [Myxococcaceae bacterium]|nr:MXAN_5187 C-terminal domain-containing protein [Myxococcaceae bacterium]
MPPPTRPEDRAKASAAAAEASWAQVAQEVDAVEVLLHALRGQYDQFFLGMEKRPPVKAHEQFKKRLATLKTVPSRNSALSFRIQSLQASAATYERLWSRTLQEMEDGTYRRDVFKARLRRKNSPETPAAPAPPPGAKKGPAGKGAEAEAPATPAAEPPIHIAGTPPPDPLAENRLRSVYRAYVEAKRRCNEDTTRLSFDAVVASLKRQVPELLERHNVRDVEYRVFVKDGKAILRAVPKV